MNAWRPTRVGIAGGRFRYLKRWRISFFLGVTTLVLASHVSDNATVLGRYSVKYAMFLMVPALLTLAASLITAFPSSTRFLLNAVGRLSKSRLFVSVGIGQVSASPPAAQCVMVVVVGLLLGQVGWFVLSVVEHPPQRIAYAALLAQPEYRGKSFVTTSYEGIAWNSTRGWTYMSPDNPPRLNPISARFRHLADWKNEAKYGHPDYFLCDNGPFSFAPPGTTMDSGTAERTCRNCTCKDVAANLKAAGHAVVVDHSDFAIVKFNWQAK